MNDKNIILYDLFDFDNSEKENTINYKSKYSNLTNLNKEELFEFYNDLNKEEYHKDSKDDECTPMELVEHMVDYIPDNFWKKDNISILDPCAGNGNFASYLKFKTDPNNIWQNELNEIRYINSKDILGFKHTYNHDFFELKSILNRKWDLIIGNPPYSGGRNKNTSVSNLFIQEAIDILLNSKEKFENKPEHGKDLGREHEKYLTDIHFSTPVFVTDWPKDIKAFYMRLNEDNETVRAVDLLVPGSGELVGGSQGEERLDQLLNRMKEMNVPADELWWYLDLRRYGGCVHSGFGMGFERMVMYLTGVENIRDVIPFPRTPNNAEF